LSAEALGADALRVVTGIWFAGCPRDVRAGLGRRARSLRGSVETGDVLTIPLGGQLGHGVTARLRRRPVRVGLPVLLLLSGEPVVRAPGLLRPLSHGREG
jgi:hypothetical protein